VNDSDDDSTRTSASSSADPPRNFTLRVDERLRALVIGAPAYATRKKHIEDLERRFVMSLVALHDALVARTKASEDKLDDDAIARALADKAAAIDLRKMNSLIASHNRYYPIEANLPMDMRTGEYLVCGRRWMPEEPWTAAHLLERARAVIDGR